jgi:hypothetical protein
MALKKIQVDRLFITTLGVIGALIFGLTVWGVGAVPSNCSNTAINGSFTFLMVLGAVCATLAITYWLCHTKGGECYASGVGDTVSEMYMYISIVIASLMMIFSAIIFTTAMKDKDCLKDSKGKVTKDGQTIIMVSGFILGVSVLSLIGLAFGLHYMKNIVPGRLLSKQQETKSTDDSSSQPFGGIRRLGMGNYFNKP